MDPITTTLISMGTSFVTTLASKGNSGGPLQTLDDLWELAFGGFHQFVEKKRAVRELNIIDFKKKLVSNIDDIPNENLQEPALNIIGPALEASKFYIEDEVIRDMFAKVIASSMDNRKTNQVHSSYVEIIKQLSPLDAKNITILKTGQKPIVEYRMNIIDGKSYHTQKTNVFISNPETQDIDLNAISTSNLARLGLSTITYTEHLTDEKYYSNFKNTNTYKSLLNNATISKSAYESLSKKPIEQQPPSEIMETLKFHNLDIQKGIIKLTPLGDSFASICC